MSNLISQLSTDINLINDFFGIVFFKKNGSEETALLSTDILINGQYFNKKNTLTHFVKENDTILFNCSSYNNSRDYNWIVNTISVIPKYVLFDIVGLDSGVMSCEGVVKTVRKHQIILTFTSAEGLEEIVLLLEKKLFIKGNRVKADKDLKVGDKVLFDAVPFDNEDNCTWFAVAAWIGVKPLSVYSITLPKLPNSLEEYKLIIHNPHSKFLRCSGKILHILNEEYGIILASIHDNCWHTVLFHRSYCYLFATNLYNTDLREILLPGDRVKLIAVLMYDQNIQWLARQVQVDDSKMDDTTK